jgi:replicative DNA helicase
LASSFNLEKLFVSKIIESQEMTKEVAATPPWFLSDNTYKEAFEYILNYYSEVGTVPTLRVFKSDCPQVALVAVPESWDDLLPRLRKQYIAGIMTEELSNDIADALDSGDVETAVNRMGALLSKVHTSIPSTLDVDVTQNGEERLERYQERRDNPGSMVGIPTGYPTIDRATQGLQQGQLVTITGLPKASKSTLAMRIAMTVQEYGKKVLYLTFEQTVAEQERRLDAYRAGFNDNLLNSGEINEEQWRALQRGVHETSGYSTMVISQDCMTVSAIAARIDLIEPDVVIVDGVYMMDDEQGEARESAAALTHIVSGLKKLAMRKMVCIVAVTQSTPSRTKGEVLNGDSMKGSRAFAEWSNTVIGIERTDDANYRRMRILLSRSCPLVDIMLQFDYDTARFVEDDEFDMDDDEELTDAEQYQTSYERVGYNP